MYFKIYFGSVDAIVFPGNILNSCTPYLGLIDNRIKRTFRKQLKHHEYYFMIIENDVDFLECCAETRKFVNNIFRSRTTNIYVKVYNL